jgi:hypothetical protein
MSSGKSSSISCCSDAGDGSGSGSGRGQHADAASLIVLRSG